MSNHTGKGFPPVSISNPTGSGFSPACVSNHTGNGFPPACMSHLTGKGLISLATLVANSVDAHDISCKNKVGLCFPSLPFWRDVTPECEESPGTCLEATRALPDHSPSRAGKLSKSIRCQHKSHTGSSPHHFLRTRCPCHYGPRGRPLRAVAS